MLVACAVVSPTCMPDAAVVEDGGALGSGDSLFPPATDGGAADSDVGSLPPSSTSPPQDLASRCAFIRSLRTFSDVRTVCLSSVCVACVAPAPRIFFCLFLMRRSHSITFTRAQGIPKYKIGFGRGK